MAQSHVPQRSRLWSKALLGRRAAWWGRWAPSSVWTLCQVPGAPRASCSPGVLSRIGAPEREFSGKTRKNRVVRVVVVQPLELTQVNGVAAPLGPRQKQQGLLNVGG